MADDIDFIKNGIESGLKVAIEKEYDLIKKEFVERLDREKDRYIAGVVLNIMSRVSYEDLGRTIRIEVVKRSDV